jgi:hypothetical protein
MKMNKEQNYLNEAIYDDDIETLDTVKKEKPKKYDKKELGYNENIITRLFKKKKVVKEQFSPKKQKKETSLGKKSSDLNIFKKKKKEISFFNKL